MTQNKQIHFEISERKILLRIFDIIFVLTVLHLIGTFFDFHYFKISDKSFYWTLVLSVYLLFFGSVFEMYNLQIASNQYSVVRSIVLTSSVTVLTYLLTPYYTPPLPENRLQILFFYIAVVSALLLWRLLYVRFLASTRFVKKAIIVCQDDELDELVNGLQKNDPHYKIEGFLNLNGDNSVVRTTINSVGVENLVSFIEKQNISEIVIASQKTEGITVELYNQLLLLLENGFPVREYTQVYESIAQRIPVQFVARDFYKFFPFSRSNQNQLYLIYVRLVEIISAILGLTIGLFLLPFILFGNLIANQGPLFYTQDRVGKNGAIFKIYKLRSMIINAESGGAVFATVNDTRITAFGKFLRKSRLDEVPQFINVLKGEMAIIGPRPERPVFVNQIAEIMPFYQTRHVIKPGLTGWAQVNYSYGETLQDSLIKLQYDLYYIKHRSVFLDLSIVVKTISTVLFYRGQ
ncbi:MAG: exopolysaccharide biosynthesis polyprenyl glycosylphosphotransferase [Bacteroidota bacterium]